MHQTLTLYDYLCLFLPFMLLCNYWCPSYLFMPLHLLTLNISLCSCLCPSYLSVPFFLHLFVHSHPFVVLSLYCIIYVNILINLHIIINIMINSYLFCLNFHNRTSFSEMVKTRGNFGWVSTPYIDLSHKMSPVVKVTSKAIRNCSRVSHNSFRLWLRYHTRFR